MLRFTALTMAIAVAGCSGEAPARKGENTGASPATLSAHEVQALEGCAAHLAALGEIASGETTAFVVARKCLPACPPAHAPGQTGALASTCGYSVGSGPADRFVVAESSKWISSLRARATPANEALFARLDAAMARVPIAVSVPSTSPHYKLPVSTSRLEPARSGDYVVVTEREMRVGSTPALLITKTGVEAAPLPGGPFPGKVTTADRLRDTLAELDAQREPEVAKADDDDDDDDDDADDPGGTGTKMALDEGKMGTKESSRQAGQYAMKKTGVDPQLAREQALDAARRAGVLGVLRKTSSTQVLADHELAATRLHIVVDALAVVRLSVMKGDAVGVHPVALERGGRWARAFVAFKANAIEIISESGEAEIPDVGGKRDWQTLLGKLRTVPENGVAIVIEPSLTVGALVRALDQLAARGDSSVGLTTSLLGDLRGRRAEAPVVRIGNATATGDLDKNIIRRYIRRKAGAIRNCYERRLLVEPKLAGKMATTFKIKPDGTTSDVVASGLHPEVDSCVAGVIKSIRFPKPRGGGFVNVTYPFVFSAK